MQSLLINATLLIADTNRVPRSKINLDLRSTIASLCAYPPTKLFAMKPESTLRGIVPFASMISGQEGATRMERCGEAESMSVLLLLLLLVVVVVVIVTRIHGGLTVPRGITWVT